jgi:hypothetical protein
VPVTDVDRHHESGGESLGGSSRRQERRSIADVVTRLRIPRVDGRSGFGNFENRLDGRRVELETPNGWDQHDPADDRVDDEAGTEAASGTLHAPDDGACDATQQEDRDHVEGQA